MEVCGTEDVISMTGKSAMHYAAMLSSGVAILVVARVAVAQDSAKGSARNYAALVAAPDRTDADRQTDQRRDPLQLLVFAPPRPGLKALDMGAGGGYSTELMARTVAPTGGVYGQNPAGLSQRAKGRFEARLKTPGG